ncbi:MAG: prepilin-type N-terminal cleavage/methylation domain-containing protein [Paracoccaceae bacterium]
MTRSTSGYSLIEVLIAFVILVSVLAVLLPSNATLFAAIPRTEERVLAQDYAQSRIATLGISRSVAIGEIQGTYRDKWIWHEVIIQRPELITDGQLFEITVKILSPDQSELAQVTLIRVQK